MKYSYSAGNLYHPRNESRSFQAPWKRYKDRRYKTGHFLLFTIFSSYSCRPAKLLDVRSFIVLMFYDSYNNILPSYLAMTSLSSNELKIEDILWQSPTWEAPLAITEYVRDLFTDRRGTLLWNTVVLLQLNVSPLLSLLLWSAIVNSPSCLVHCFKCC